MRRHHLIFALFLFSFIAACSGSSSPPAAVEAAPIAGPIGFLGAGDVAFSGSIGEIGVYSATSADSHYEVQLSFGSPVTLSRTESEDGRYAIESDL